MQLSVPPLRQPVQSRRQHDPGPDRDHRRWHRHADHEPAGGAQRLFARDDGRIVRGAAAAGGGPDRAPGGDHRRRQCVQRRWRRQGLCQERRRRTGRRLLRHQGHRPACAHGGRALAARDAQADAGRDSGRGGRRWAVGGAGLRPAHRCGRRQVHHGVLEDRSVRRLRRQLLPEPPGGRRQGARDVLHRPGDQRRRGAAHRPGQPRGAGRAAGRRRTRLGGRTGGAAHRGRRLHEAQPQHRVARLAVGRVGCRGAAHDPHFRDRGPQGRRGGLRREAAAQLQAGAETRAARAGLVRGFAPAHHAGRRTYDLAQVA